MAATDEALFRDAIDGLSRGDFSRLAPLFATDPNPIIRWHKAGRFRDEPKAEAEALTCACFLGSIAVAEYLLDRALDPSGGSGTGMNAFHWAVNRGQLKTVRLLLQRKAPLETRSMHGGTILGTATWSAVHEPRPDHLLIIEELLKAGADVNEAEYPTDNELVDALLRRYGITGEKA